MGVFNDYLLKGQNPGPAVISVWLITANRTLKIEYPFVKYIFLAEPRGTACERYAMTCRKAASENHRLKISGSSRFRNHLKGL
jgi:hypothetical protein